MNDLSYSRLVSVKPFSSYTQDQINNIRLISFNKHDLAIPFGSAVYRIQKYPGDLDLYESFVECCSIDDMLRKFIRILKRITEDIVFSKLHFFSEFKAGLDLRYDVNIGTLNNGIFQLNIREVSYKSKDLYKKHLLTDEEFEKIQEIIRNPTPGGDKYDELYDLFREKRIIRWSAKDILKGYKMLPGNHKMTLYDALKIRTHVKIDVITLINGKFIEVTNFLILYYEDSQGELKIVNLDYDFNDLQLRSENYKKQIRDEIEKFYYSNLFYNPFKMAKRMWAYSRYFQYEDCVKLLTPLISGNISYLYQIKSEIEAILRVFELVEADAPMKLINKQLDGLKLKLANIIELSDDKIEKLDKLINAFLHPSSFDIKNDLLKYIKDLIKSYINNLTIEGLQQICMNPPMKVFLPDNPKYYSITRTADQPEPEPESDIIIL